MRSLRISCALLAALIIFIGFNSYYINSFSSAMLDRLYMLPCDPDTLKESEKLTFERVKADINAILQEWENHSARLGFSVRFSDFERVNVALISMREYFFAKRYADYTVMRLRAIIALEKQKQNELPNFDNIF